MASGFNYPKTDRCPLTGTNHLPLVVCYHPKGFFLGREENALYVFDFQLSYVYVQFHIAIPKSSAADGSDLARLFAGQSSFHSIISVLSRRIFELRPPFSKKIITPFFAVKHGSGVQESVILRALRWPSTLKEG